MHWFGEGNGTPLQYFCLENPMDGGVWWAAVHGAHPPTVIFNPQVPQPSLLLHGLSPGTFWKMLGKLSDGEVTEYILYCPVLSIGWTLLWSCYLGEAYVSDLEPQAGSLPCRLLSTQLSWICVCRYAEPPFCCPISSVLGSGA